MISYKMEAQIRKNFSGHPVSDEQCAQHRDIREGAAKLARMMVEFCPESRELSLAMTNLEQVVFWANAAIARSGV